VRAYSRCSEAGYLLLRIDADAVAAAREWLRRLLPLVDTAVASADAPATPETAPALDVAFTHRGLERLGLGRQILEGFSAEFRLGSAARAGAIGDIEHNAPSAWSWGTQNDPVHVLLMIFPRESDPRSIVEHVERIEKSLPSSIRVVHKLIGALQDAEPFGFRDGISQPELEGLPARNDRSEIHRVEAGEFVLGYRNELGYLPESPSVPVTGGQKMRLRGGRRDWGRNGSYLVFRQLEQDVEGFQQFLRTTADTLGVAPELVGARMVGRWKGGAPLVLSPDCDDPAQKDANDFLYATQDPDGVSCPIGSHVRRSNPRDAFASERLGITSNDALQRANLHRLLRRGRPYTHAGKQGLLFVCLNANIQRQFEFVQKSWIGSPSFGGLSSEQDPLLGSCAAERSFTWSETWAHGRMDGLSSFVRVVGSEYFFLPSLAALASLAGVTT